MRHCLGQRTNASAVLQGHAGMVAGGASQQAPSSGQSRGAGGRVDRRVRAGAQALGELGGGGPAIGVCVCVEQTGRSSRITDRLESLP